MRIIAYKKIDEFAKRYPDAKAALDDWYTKIEEADLTGFADVKKISNSVDSVGNKRYVFNIRGSSYRLIALILFEAKIVYIRHIDTHSGYDKIKDCSIV